MSSAYKNSGAREDDKMGLRLVVDNDPLNRQNFRNNMELLRNAVKYDLASLSRYADTLLVSSPVVNFKEFRKLGLVSTWFGRIKESGNINQLLENLNYLQILVYFQYLRKTVYGIAGLPEIDFEEELYEFIDQLADIAVEKLENKNRPENPDPGRDPNVRAVYEKISRASNK